MTKIYKFVSKIANYSITLKPGLEGNKAFGVQPVPRIHLTFKNGEVVISKPVMGIEPEELYEMAKQHASFGSGFLDATEGLDPFAGTRAETEPRHEITEMKYGTPVNTINATKKNILTPEQKKAMKETLVGMLNDMSTDELKAILNSKMGGKEEEVSEKKEVDAQSEEETKDKETKEEDKKELTPTTDKLKELLEKSQKATKGKK